MPQGGDPDLDAQFLAAPLLEFSQSQVRLLGDPSSQGPFMRSQARPAVATDLLGPAVARPLLLVPEPFHAAAAHPKTLADLSRTGAVRSGRDDALT
jgi:hypothetical protein